MSLMSCPEAKLGHRTHETKVGSKKLINGKVHHYSLSFTA
jgi:hypothetical protein